jgi:hypothetical protein
MAHAVVDGLGNLWMVAARGSARMTSCRYGLKIFTGYQYLCWRHL